LKNNQIAKYLRSLEESVRKASLVDGTGTLARMYQAGIVSLAEGLEEDNESKRYELVCINDRDTSLKKGDTYYGTIYPCLNYYEIEGQGKIWVWRFGVV
jgi:hypothetical protein